MMKYIAPGSWFSLEYPSDWREFEDTEDSFLFYNPDNGEVISAFPLFAGRTVRMPVNVSIMN